MKLPGSEDDLNKEIIYEQADIVQQRPISGIMWPGWMRNWIFSRKLQPVVVTGVLTDGNTYEEDWLTGIVSFWEAMSSYLWTTVLSAIVDFFTKTNSTDAAIIATDTEVNVASQAGLTLTCAAGRAYKVIFASLSNANRQPTPTLTYTPSGGTAAIYAPATTAIQTASNVLIGGHTVGTGVGGGYSGPDHIWLQAGDTLTLTDGAFVAADVMRHQFIYEDYDI